MFSSFKIIFWCASTFPSVLAGFLHLLANCWEVLFPGVVFREKRLMLHKVLICNSNFSILAHLSLIHCSYEDPDPLASHPNLYLIFSMSLKFVVCTFSILNPASSDILIRTQDYTTTSFSEHDTCGLMAEWHKWFGQFGVSSKIGKHFSLKPLNHICVLIKWFRRS